MRNRPNVQRTTTATSIFPTGLYAEGGLDCGSAPLKSGSDLSATFMVQRGRTYLLGVVSRVSAVSTLTSTTGDPLAPVSNTMLRVWGAMNSVIPQMNVWKKRVDIP
jgi:hypothetical protein